MKTLKTLIGCAFFLIAGLILFNRYWIVEASLPETSIYQKTEACLPPKKSVKEIKYITSLKEGNATYYSFYITQKIPIYFADNIEEVIRRAVVKVDDIGCLVIMPVEKFEDSMTLYMPEQVAFGLLEKETQIGIAKAGGIEQFLKKYEPEESMDKIGDSDYMFPEAVYVYKKLGLPLSEPYTVIDSLTKAPEYIPTDPARFPDDYPDNSIFRNQPSKPSKPSKPSRKW